MVGNTSADVYPPIEYDEVVVGTIGEGGAVVLPQAGAAVDTFPRLGNLELQVCLCNSISYVY